MRTRTRKTLGLGLTAVVAALAMSACNEDGGDADGDCVNDETYFQENVYAPILADNCETCHSNAGAAKNTSFILRAPESGPDYLEQNLEMFHQLSKLEYEGQPWILLKPTMQISHEGGERFASGSDEYAAFVDMIDRLNNPVECESDADNVDEFFGDVELLDERATLRKATLALAGRLPTLEEDQFVQSNSWEGVDAVLDNVMQEPTFYDRMREIYNDKFLTDRYYDGTQAIDLLDQEDYPDAYWFDAMGEGDARNDAADKANRGLAREPIELLIHVLKNNLPYTELLTADYTMVNYYSAQTLGVSANFTTDQSYDEFVPAKVPGIPHAGALTTVTFLNRFPTTDTNRNRHRSRMVHEFFLATDVQSLGSRPVDATAIVGHNPTMNDPECTICHDVVDPMAGSFQNWDDQGRYRPPELGWFPDMRPAGFGEAQMPGDQSPMALPWAVREVVKDPRFALAAVHIMFEGLAGQKPLKEPDDPTAASYLGAIKAAQVQREEFDRIGQLFVDSNYDLKVVIKEIVQSRYYRAYNYSSEGLDEAEATQRAFELAETGMGRLLIPEQLTRKITATTGYPWRPGSDETDYLLDEGNYLVFYGGIDSDTVTTRITSPNGVMANVAKRMANEMSCLAVPQDFAKPASERTLFRLVEPTHEPQDANGFEIPGSVSVIRANIQFLVQRLWGEYLELDDPEIDRIYDLYVKVWQEGQIGLQNPNEEERESSQVPGQCQARSDYFTGEEFSEDRAVADDEAYTIRAWMAVTTYMLSDFRFLHE